MSTTWKETFALELTKLPSARIFELHREVAREATKRYRRTTKYQQNYRTGMNAARAKTTREDTSATGETDA